MDRGVDRETEGEAYKTKSIHWICIAPQIEMEISIEINLGKEFDTRTVPRERQGRFGKKELCDSIDLPSLQQVPMQIFGARPRKCVIWAALRLCIFGISRSLSRNISNFGGAALCGHILLRILVKFLKALNVFIALWWNTNWKRIARNFDIITIYY